MLPLVVFINSSTNNNDVLPPLEVIHSSCSWRSDRQDLSTLPHLFTFIPNAGYADAILKSLLGDPLLGFKNLPGPVF